MHPTVYRVYRNVPSPALHSARLHRFPHPPSLPMFQGAAVAAAGTYAQMAGLPPYEDIPVSQIKRVTASRLLESKTTIPHYYLSVDCNVDNMMKLRAQLNKTLEKEGTKVSVNDFIIKARKPTSSRPRPRHRPAYSLWVNSWTGNRHTSNQIHPWVKMPSRRCR